MRFYQILFSCLLLYTAAFGQNTHIYKIGQSNVSFNSSAPKEFISANSKQLKGLIDFDKGTFVFKIKMNSFEGFNNELQREHFNENYVESSIYPDASYNGKIIETIDLNQNQNIKIRSKGKFTLHGVSKECIIYVVLKINNKKIAINSDFSINLRDYNIKIPKVVYNKLAPEIDITLNAQLVSL